MCRLLSEDIHHYRLMEAWRDNKHIDYNIFDLMRISLQHCQLPNR